MADWARERGFSLQLTYSVLNGRLRARRGESHRIAVALGLKPDRSAAQEPMAVKLEVSMEGAMK